MSITEAGRSGSRNWWAIVAGGMTAAILLLLGLVGFLGYFGGPIYRVAPPLAPTPAAQRGTAIVFLSGDMGINAGMGPRLIDRLRRQGLPVLAVNSLTAFSTRRSPAQIEAIVAEAIVRALAMPGAHRVVMIGQSFGADMLQFSATGLPPALRSRIGRIVLLVPGNTLLFQASPGGVLDGAPDAAALPSARRIDWVPLTCIHGVEETHSLCPALHGDNVTNVPLPGGHFLNYDIPLITQALDRAIDNGR